MQYIFLFFLTWISSASVTGVLALYNIKYKLIRTHENKYLINKDLLGIPNKRENPYTIQRKNITKMNLSKLIKCSRTLCGGGCSYGHKDD